MMLEIRKRCEGQRTFGEVLGDLLAERKMRQTQLARLIHYSDGTVSKLIDDQISDKMALPDVIYIANCIGCSEIEIYHLIRAFECYALKKRGLW